MSKNELYKGLTEEQIAKAKACKTHEELLKLSKEEGIELTEEQLEAVSGASLCGTTKTIPCKKVGCDGEAEKISGFIYKCRKCGYEFCKD